MLSMMSRCKLDAILVWIYWIIPVLLSSEPPVSKVLRNPNSQYDFTHLCAHGSDGLIIGGTNYIHRVFAGNLSLETSQKIGPKLDNPNCLNLNNIACDKEMYNSYIKVLLVDTRTKPNQDQLIICTSLFQGTCVKRNPFTLELLPNFGPNVQLLEPIVANNKTATTFAFLAPGPGTDGASQSTALYVGASWTNTGLRALRSLVPSFSSRNTRNFDFTFKDLATNSYVMVDEINRDSFPIRYIYGFPSGHFSYLGTIQKISVAAEDYVSKLIRVCQFDKSFYSYAETYLRCQKKGKLYNLLQTAYLSKPGSHLAKALQISEDEDVLFGMFGIGNPDTPVKNDKRSAMCIFSSRQIKQVFSRNTRTCFRGTGRTGPDHLVAPTNCQPTIIDISDDYCGKYDFNTPINGPEAIASTTSYVIDVTASSLIVTTTPTGHTVAFIGTTEGVVKKVRVDAPGIVEEYSEAILDVGMPIIRYTFTDYNRQHLYVLTPRKLIKMNVETCTHIADCDKCFRDPFCIWNTQKIKCMSSADVSSSDALLGSCPKITSVNKTGTNNIPTLLVISVANLQQFRLGQYACVYSGYGEKLTRAAERIRDHQIQCIIPWNELPPFPLHRGCIRMNLSLLLDEMPIAFGSIDFFDCEVTNKSCSTRNCTVDGFWSSFRPFSNWSTCSQSCGGGHQNRTQYRTCTEPPPSGEGNDCEGSEHNEEIRQCNEQDCPVYGTWTDFQIIQNWSQCSVSCGDGKQSRIRLRNCISSIVKVETETCAGSAFEPEIRACNTEHCSSGETVAMISSTVTASIVLIIIVICTLCIWYRRKRKPTKVLSSPPTPQEEDAVQDSHYNYITGILDNSDRSVYEEIVDLAEADPLSPGDTENDPNIENEREPNETSPSPHQYEDLTKTSRECPYDALQRPIFSETTANNAI